MKRTLIDSTLTALAAVLALITYGPGALQSLQSSVPVELAFGLANLCTPALVWMFFIPSARRTGLVVTLVLITAQFVAAMIWSPTATIVFLAAGAASAALTAMAITAYGGMFLALSQSINDGRHRGHPRSLTGHSPQLSSCPTARSTP